MFDPPRHQPLAAANCPIGSGTLFASIRFNSRRDIVLAQDRVSLGLLQFGIRISDAAGRLLPRLQAQRLGRKRSAAALLIGA